MDDYTRIEDVLLPWVPLEKVTNQLWKNPHMLAIPFAHYLLSKREQQNNNDNNDNDNDDNDDNNNPHIVDIRWSLLCQNHSRQAVQMIVKGLEVGQITESMLNWYWLSGNPFAVDLLLSDPKYQHHIHWYMLYKNPSATSLFTLHNRSEDHHLYWLNPEEPWEWDSRSTKVPSTCSGNPHPLSIEQLIANPWWIHPNWFSTNTHPDAIRFISAHLFDPLYEWNWAALSANPAAVDLLYAYPDRIVWEALSANPNPRILPLLESNPDKIDWNAFSANPCLFA